MLLRPDQWTRTSIDKFIELVHDQKYVSFHVDTVQSGRSFGQLLLHSGNDDDDNTFSIVNGLCELNVAVRDRNYIHGNTFACQMLFILTSNFKYKVEVFH